MESFKLYAVTGNPVIHSKSPDIYNSLFSHYDINARYVRLLAESANEALDIYRSLGLAGMNVTAPFKEGVFTLVDANDESAIDAGGVNTVVGESALTGYSTDSYGVERSLTNAGASAGMNAVVLGAGGAAMPAVTALKRIGCEITVINRTLEKAQRIARVYSVECAPLDALEEILSSAQILVSTLPAGSDVGAERLIKPGMLILDANYKSSTLHAAASAAGAVFISGMHWLCNQGLRSFELYTGRTSTYDELSALMVPEDLSARTRSIVLTGFMGTGKSTVAAELSRLSGRVHYDTDALVEAEYGKSVQEIFSIEGEPFFRRLESEILAKVLEHDNAVISCGGGIILDANNRALIKKNALTIWLYADLANVISRMDGTRPLLNVDDPMKKAEEIFSSRKKMYAECCDLLIANSGRLPQTTAEMIHEEISTLYKY